MSLSPKDAPGLTDLNGYHAWKPRLSLGMSPGVGGRPKEDMHFSLTLLWVPTYCMCPHAPWGSWRWSSDGLVILGMRMGEARIGWCLGSPHPSWSPCSPHWEFLAGNLKNSAISTHAIISLKILMRALMKIYVLELLHSTQSATEGHRPGVGRQCSYPTSPGQRRDIFNKHILMKALITVCSLSHYY